MDKFLGMDREQLLEYCASMYNGSILLTKDDIMVIYKCEADKARRILKILFQMKYATKVGKEYYISKASHDKFLKDKAGRQVLI